MAANTKYQQVPARDSEEQTFTQAPPAYTQPSYQAESNVNPGGYGAAPRSEDDNLPDDFKFGGVVSEATLDIRMAFIRKVYLIL